MSKAAISMAILLGTISGAPKTAPAQKNATLTTADMPGAANAVGATGKKQPSLSVKHKAKGTKAAGTAKAGAHQPVISPIPAHGFTVTPMPPEVAKAWAAQWAESDRQLKKARSLYEAGDLTGAEQACFAAVGATPPAPNGQKLRPPASIAFLLGDIYLRQGKYQKALACYLPASQRAWRAGGVNLDAALCYARLGNDKMARRFYSDKVLLQYRAFQKGGLPGTSNRRSLEASILLARGMNAFISGRKQAAFENLDAAGKLAPSNELIAYYSGMSLVHMHRYAESAPYFRRAAQLGHGKRAANAKGMASAAEHMNGQSPTRAMAR